MTIEQFFGTMVQSPVEVWKKHLETPKYSAHMALDTCYQELPELVDTTLEDYMGIIGGKVEKYVNVLSSDKMSAYDYLMSLRDFVLNAREELFSEMPSIQSDIDDILKLVNQTMYRLHELTESRSCLAFIKDALIND